jgi:hypothetical protein
MIKPTVGCKVWYWPSRTDRKGNFGMTQIGCQPLDATVLYAWSDSMVNLQVVDHYGKVFNLTSVTLAQDDFQPARDEDGLPVSGYAEWMPYQKGQATKAEQSEEKVAS